MTPLTVVCLWVQGEYPYTVDYVCRLKAMVERWIDRPFRFVCLTDQPWALPSDIESIPVSRLPGFAFWTKLELFNPSRAWSGRMLYLDLDTLIVGPLAPIVDFPAPFALTADPVMHGRAAKLLDAHRRRIVRRFNSSVMVWDGGTQTSLFTRFTPLETERLSGDQDFVAEQAPHAEGMPRAWFPRLSEVGDPPFDPEVKVILSKVPKNHLAAKSIPWFEPLWGAACA
jgi:hypothetical protein